MLVAVVGATATGKSDLAVGLALALGGEVVNADSMQLYRGMDIGTAKLSIAERRGIPHHLLDVWDVTKTASVAEYQALAEEVIAGIEARGKVPVLAGGSGLYVRAALGDLDFPGTDERIRAGLEAELAAGPGPLYARLTALDPPAAAAILPSNGRRIVRALEVIELSGRPFSATLPGYDGGHAAVQIGLALPRQELDRRIEARVDQMWAAGFAAEVRELRDRERLRDGKTASRALGYQQMLRHLDGEWTLDQAREETVRATRRFARRQESWFRRDPRVTWLPADEPDVTGRALSLLGPLSRLAGQPVGALCVLRRDHAGDALGVGVGHVVDDQPGLEEPRQRPPEQQRVQVVEFRQAEGVGREQELAQRHQFERLGEHLGCPGADVVRCQSEVCVHVREDLGQVACLPVVRVVVQQHDRRPGRL